MLLEKRIELSGHNGSIYTIDGFDDFIFTGSGDKYVAKWNLITGVQEKFSIKVNSSIFKIKLINSNRNLIIGTDSGSLHVIDLLSKEEIKHFIQHNSAIFEIQENKLNNHFYSTDANGNLAVWNKKTFELLLFFPLECGKIRQILVNSDGTSIFLACQNGEIKEFDTEYFNEKNTISAHSLGVNCLVAHPKNENIIISGGKDGLIKFWDLKINLKKILEIPAHNFGIYQLDFVNDAENFISISRDKSIKVWDAQKLNVVQKIERKNGGHSHAINSFWKKSETEIITVGDDKRIIYWELKI